MKKIIIITGLIVITAAAAGVLFLSGGQKQADYGKLVGDWGRTDGDYVIRIRGINPDGTIQVVYSNPNPIHVAVANIASENNTVKLFIELRDVGYPGSKYDLAYNTDEDILQGMYFQAQLQRSYDVVFQRMK